MPASRFAPIRSAAASRASRSWRPSTPRAAGHEQAGQLRRERRAVAAGLGRGQADHVAGGRAGGGQPGGDAGVHLVQLARFGGDDHRPGHGVVGPAHAGVDQGVNQRRVERRPGGVQVVERPGPRRVPRGNHAGPRRRGLARPVGIDDGHVRAPPARQPERHRRPGHACPDDHDPQRHGRDHTTAGGSEKIGAGRTGVSGVTRRVGRPVDNVAAARGGASRTVGPVGDGRPVDGAAVARGRRPRRRRARPADRLPTTSGQ